MILSPLTFLLLFLKFAMGKVEIYLLLCYCKYFEKHFTEVFIELCLDKHMNFDVAIATEKVVFSKPLMYIQVDFFWMRHNYGGGHWLGESSRQNTSR